MNIDHQKNVPDSLNDAMRSANAFANGLSPEDTSRLTKILTASLLS